MGLKTGVEWAQSSVGWWRGCEWASEGCDRCYAKAEMRRYGHDPDLVTRAADDTFYAPLKWKEPRIIYACPWSDFFLPGADRWRADAWGVIRETPRHFYLIPTKRPENILARLPEDWPLANVGLLVTAENQERLQQRVPTLLSIEAALHGISYEPALGPISLRTGWDDYIGGEPHTTEAEADRDPETGEVEGCSPVFVPFRKGLDWIILGGESGPGARAMELSWAHDVITECRVHAVPVFVKQLGSAYAEAAGRRVEDPRAANPAEWPASLRIREFPLILKPFLQQEAKTDG